MLAIFDSGIGGLTLWQEIKKSHPEQGILYFSDTAHMPYGEKSPEEIVVLTQYGIQRLIEHGATHIILGCHTAATHLPEGFLERFPCHFYDIAAAALEMAAPYKDIAVIGTKATIASEYYQTYLGNRLLTAFACPLLAPMIEKGEIELKVIEDSLSPLPKAATSLLYACTHFPLIDAPIASLTSLSHRLNPATHLVQKLPRIGEASEDLFLTSGDPQLFYTVASSFSLRKLSFPFSIKSLY